MLFSWKILLRGKKYYLAKVSFQKACDYDYGKACVMLGSMYILGEGVPQDSIKANQIFIKAKKLLYIDCENGDQESCNQ